MEEKSKVDIRALAALARLDINDTEVEKLEHEIPGILSFVETIQKIDITHAQHDTSLRNVMRADADPHESGIHTQALLDAAPLVHGNRVVVRQVLTRKSSSDKSASDRT